MKFSTLLRITAIVVLGGVLLAWAAALSAADATGGSPQDGIPVAVIGTQEVCTSQTLASGAQVWLKVPYHAGTDLEMHVKGGSGVNFDVYDPSQAANWPTLPPQPIGRLLLDPNEPGYTNTWRGHLGIGNQSDFFYVLVTNTNQFPVTFSFCTFEAQQFVPPPWTLVTTVASSSESASSIASSSSSD